MHFTSWVLCQNMGHSFGYFMTVSIRKKHTSKCHGTKQGRTKWEKELQTDSPLYVPLMLGRFGEFLLRKIKIVFQDIQQPSCSPNSPTKLVVWSFWGKSTVPLIRSSLEVNLQKPTGLSIDVEIKTDAQELVTRDTLLRLVQINANQSLLLYSFFKIGGCCL